MAKPKWPPTPNSLGPTYDILRSQYIPNTPIAEHFVLTKDDAVDLDLRARQDLVRIVKLMTGNFYRKKFLVYLKNLKKKVAFVSIKS